MKPPRAVIDYMAQIGKKGGEAKGKRKARSPEHYAKMIAARKKRNENEKTNQRGIPGTAPRISD